MSDDRNNSKPTARPGLRLVRQEPEGSEAPAAPEAPPAPKAARRSPFLEFMNAYADAVDQQVKILLDV